MPPGVVGFVAPSLALEAQLVRESPGEFFGRGLRELGHATEEPRTESLQGPTEFVFAGQQQCQARDEKTQKQCEIRAHR